MIDEPQTRATLLMRVRDLGDAEAWSQFVRLYLPLIYKHLQRRGLQHDDAADVAQEVLRSVVAAMPGFEYEPSRGTFRGWLLAVTRSRAADWRLRNRRQFSRGDSAVVDWADRQAVLEDRERWEADYRQQVFQLACDRVRPEVSERTWQIFWRTAIEGMTAAEAAAALELSIGAIYVARSRVTARLREAVQQLEEQE